MADDRIWDLLDRKIQQVQAFEYEGKIYRSREKALLAAVRRYSSKPWHYFMGIGLPICMVLLLVAAAYIGAPR